MRRRAFIAGLSASAGVPFVARSEVSDIRKVGVLMGASESDRDQSALVDIFARALSESGWQEGKTVQIIRRWANGDAAAMDKAAAELAALAPAVIFGQGTPAMLALKRATSTVPLVFANVADPVGSKMVASLASPGGNMTGFTNYEQSIAGKWVELLAEAAPKLERLLVILNPDSVATAMLVQAIEAAAVNKNIEVQKAAVRTGADIENSILKFVEAPHGGLLIMPDFLPLANRELIVRLELSHDLPSIHPFRTFVSGGGLMSYGVNNADMFRRAAGYADKILRGAKAAVLPVQAPTVFELIVNLKTAKTLGLEIPSTLLARADEVIE